jgi:hypothetical protein
MSWLETIVRVFRSYCQWIWAKVLTKGEDWRTSGLEGNKDERVEAVLANIFSCTQCTGQQTDAHTASAWTKHANVVLPLPLPTFRDETLKDRKTLQIGK